MATSLQGIANQIFDVLFADPGEDHPKQAVATTSDRTEQEMRIITSNIRKDLAPHRKVVECASLLRGRGSIIGFQEIESAEHHDALRTGLPGFQFALPGNSCPIGYDPTIWTIAGSGKEMIHNGLAGASPARWNTWALFQSRIRPSLPPIAVLNTHMDVKNKANSLKAPEWRAEMWAKHLGMLRKRTASLSNGGRTTVFLTGDYNSNTVDIPGVRWLANNGIDKIGVLQGTGITAVKKTVVRIPDPSDHDALVLAVQLRRN